MSDIKNDDFVIQVKHPGLTNLLISANNNLDDLAARTSELEEKAGIDVLTGLPNRRAFLDEGSTSVATGRRNGSRRLLIFFDFDGLKDINDTLGHKKGDEVLQILGQSMSAMLRPGDLVARLGGDEFVMLLNEGTLERASTEIAEVMRNRIEKVSGYHISMGCADFEDIVGKITELKGVTPEAATKLFEVSRDVGLSDQEVLDQMINIADERMYQDKELRKTLKNEKGNE